MSSRFYLTITSSLLTVALIASCSPTTTAKPELSASTYSAMSAQNQAQDILNKAIKAAGGLENLNTLRQGTITVSVRGSRTGQGPTPDAVGKLGNPSKTMGHRLGGKTAIERFNGDNLGSRYIRGELVDWIYFVGQNSVADVEPSLAAGIISQVNSSGHILLDLSDRSENLRAGSRMSKDGQEYDTLSYANSLGQQETLYFDIKSGHLHAAEQVRAHAQWGDTVIERRFGDYKDMGEGLTLAQTVSTFQAGMLSNEVTLTSLSNDDIDANIFKKPEDATINDPFTASTPVPRDLEVETLAEDIYFIKDAAQGYNVIFIDQDDGILVLETPQSTQASRNVIRTINAKLPGKKIKGAVPTHHHFDHSGGLYGYLKAGIPIITTPGNVEFVKQVGNADRVIGRNTGKADAISVTSFDEKKHVMGSGNNRVELINVGPNPHAEEIIVMHIPAIDALFVADVFSRRSENLPPANANQLAFADSLEDLNIDPKTYIPVHGANTTREDFWDSVKRGREAANKDR